MKQTSCLKAPWILFLLLFLFSISAFGQTITVRGSVQDGSSAPLPGVNIKVQGSATGTSTDIDGKYSIQVPSNAKLTFSFIGFNTQVIAVNGKTTLNITLVEDTKALSEVVVVGYGTQRKEAITGSVASVNGNALREVPASNISQALQGRVAGVDMEQTSTKPGTTMQIRIRGTRSINASNDPLVVLDGIPFAGTIADISTDDIKSIDILKDASATAIYGSRGANGVILVTTNKGTKGQQARLTYNGYYGVKDAIKYPMMNGTEFAALRKRAALYLTAGADEPHTSNTDGSVKDYTANTDWQDLFLRTGMVESHDLGISGGTEKGSYKFGANYYKDQAVLPGSDYSRYAIRGSVDQEIGKLFKVGFTTNNNYNITNGASMGMYGALNSPPVANPFNDDGSVKSVMTVTAGDKDWVYTKSTINALGDKWVDKTKAYGSYNSAYGELNIPGVEGLKYRINLGANFRMTNGGSYTGVGVFSSDPSNPNSASISNSLTTNWAVENLITFDRVFAQKHRVNAVAMYSAEQTMYNSSSIQRKNIAGDNFQYFNLGRSSTSDNNDITINSDYQGYSKNGLISYMGRLMYSYDDRYMLSATVRSDASSVLAAGHQWHTYPAVSVGWNIMKESFMKNIHAIDALKLRAGYGETSNQAVGAYATLGLLSTRPYNFSTSNATGYYVSTLPNPNLGWEYSKTKNIGIDFSILKNRLSGTIEGYITDTHDLLLNVTMPSTSGVSGFTGNVGATQNKGLEFSLHGVILENLNGWTWEAGINLYTNKNKIVRLASGATRDESSWWFVGHSLNVIFDYKRVGLYQTDAEAKLYEGSSGKAGMIKVEYTGTYNADGTPTRLITSADREIIDCDPDFQGGFNTSVAYKGFDLSIVGTFQHGGILNSTLYGSNGYLNLESGRGGQIKIDYWTPDNTGAKYPDPNGPKDSNNPKYGSTSGYFSGSFMKIRTITLGYNVNQKWIQKVGINKLRVYCTVVNPLILFSPYHTESGLDPETNSYANDSGNMAVAYSSGLKRMLTVGYNTPSTHNYMIGINVTF